MTLAPATIACSLVLESCFDGLHYLTISDCPDQIPLQAKSTATMPLEQAVSTVILGPRKS